MKKSQLNALNKMMEDPDVKGKKLIDRVIWLNTVKPKYKVGDCYEVTDPGHRIYDVPVRNFKARIEEVQKWSADKLIQYKLVAHVKSGSKEGDFTIHVLEGGIGKKVKGNNNVVAGDENALESLDVYVPGL